MEWQGGEGGRVVRSEGGEGGRVVRSEGGKGGRVARSEGGEGGRVVRSECEGFLVLFKGGECRVTPIFHIFVSDVNHRKGKAGWIQDFLVWPQEWKDSPLIFREILNIW